MLKKLLKSLLGHSSHKRYSSSGYKYKKSYKKYSSSDFGKKHYGGYGHKHYKKKKRSSFFSS
ncbi:MAG: hypothetical protein ACQET8_06745 [Bacillota bacterium]|jgi:hypothetical protein|uniref:Uncharacterized protein n=3 Tax=Fictibacillus TaxID=1329200 RepID=A0ABS2ZN65_9BACL|nr:MULTISPECIES: hypothetical protein [Bacillaceae]MBD7963006.1 hypothetical protein [Fictibacillus norfolkensis]MBH0169469.1 hypothetical protein [Fictibacillus sp. 18YEL24]MBN3554306.1 hypothetical protein [Fictibacillus nanhaiensis]